LPFLSCVILGVNNDSSLGCIVIELSPKETKAGIKKWKQRKRTFSSCTS